MRRVLVTGVTGFAGSHLVDYMLTRGDCKIFGIPNVKEAIDRTIEKGNGNALIDAALYQDIGFFQSCFRAKGTVVKLKPTEE